MFQVYTSYKQLKQMLYELLHIELLMYNQYTKPYHISNMGKRFLEMYRELLKSGIYDK
jgi:predicted transcriptional regulator